MRVVGVVAFVAYLLTIAQVPGAWVPLGLAIGALVVTAWDRSASSQSERDARRSESMSTPRPSRDQNR